MAFYCSGGGGGNGTGSVAGNSSTNITLFTTPNVANTLYLVTVQTRQDEAIVEQTADSGASSSGGWGWGYGTMAVTMPNDYGYNQTFKVGPNVAVKIPIANCSVTHAGYAYSYQYVSFIVDNT